MRIFRHAIRETGSYRGWLHLGGSVELSVEATTNRHGFFHCELGINGSESDFGFDLAIPKVFAIWIRVKLGPLGLTWKSRNPLHCLFIGGKPKHAGGSGLWYGPLGGEARHLGFSYQHGRMTLKFFSGGNGSTRSPRLPLRERLRREPLGEGNQDFRRIYQERQARRRELLEGKPLRKRFRPDVGYELDLMVDPRDRLLGRRVLLDEEITEENVPAVVPMPEGNYPCHVTLKRLVYGRKRWPWSHVDHYSADVEMDVPVPFPGKGENSYDLDDDAFYSSHAPARTVAQAVAEMASSAMTRRERYGSGQGWTPADGWPPGVLR